MNTPAIIAPDVLKVLNQMGYHGPAGNDPEIVNVDGDPVANLKKPGRFAIAACQSEEFGHTYTVYNLTHYPEQNLNPRPGHAGPVAALQIRTILEEDLPKLPEFEQKLVNASRCL